MICRSAGPRFWTSLELSPAPQPARKIAAITLTRSPLRGPPAFGPNEECWSARGIVTPSVVAVVGDGRPALPAVVHALPLSRHLGELARSTRVLLARAAAILDVLHGGRERRAVPRVGGRKRIRHLRARIE